MTTAVPNTLFVHRHGALLETWVWTCRPCFDDTQVDEDTCRGHEASAAAANEAARDHLMTCPTVQAGLDRLIADILELGRKP